MPDFIHQFSVLLVPAAFLFVAIHFEGKHVVFGVVVDGARKSELSAVIKQTTDEESSIDAYNTKTCGVADPNWREH